MSIEKISLIVGSISMGVGIISMIAGIVSAVVAVKSKNEAKGILREVNNIKIEVGQANESEVKPAGDVVVKNDGDNSGIIGGIITGGVNK